MKAELQSLATIFIVLFGSTHSFRTTSIQSYSRAAPFSFTLNGYNPWSFVGLTKRSTPSSSPSSSPKGKGKF